MDIATLTKALRNLFSVVPQLNSDSEESAALFRANSGEPSVTHAHLSSGIVEKSGNVFTPRVKWITGTSYTLSPEDCGALLLFTDDGSEVIVTAPDTLPENFSCATGKEGTSDVSIGVSGNATVQAASTTISTQYTAKTVQVVRNTDGRHAELRFY